MEKFLNKFYEIIETLGKRNVILIIFIFFVLMVTGLYQTFSIYTESEGLSIVDGIKTYNFILNASNSTNTVTIAAGESKNVDITVYNDSVADLQYKLYSSITSDDESDVFIGYLTNTAYLPSGVIPAKTSYVVTLKVYNYSVNDITIDFGVLYGLEDAGDLTLSSGQYEIEVLTLMKTLFDTWNGDYNYYRTDEYRNNIVNASFVDLDDNGIESSLNSAVKIWNISANGSSDDGVVAWVIDNGTTDSSGNPYYDLYIGAKEKIYTDSLYAMFSQMSALKNVSFTNLNSSLTTDMAFFFRECTSLIGSEKETDVWELDLGGLDTSNVTNMWSIFGKCSSLTNVNLSSFDTSKVTDMSTMFLNCSSLTSLDLSNFNTSNVTKMVQTFEGCSSLIELDLSSFDTSNVTSMNSMFSGCSSLKGKFNSGYLEWFLNLSNFDTKNVTDMQGMFHGCSSLLNLILTSFDTSNVTTMHSMFRDCSGLTSLDISNFDTSSVTDMYEMFGGCSSLTSLDLSSFNTSKVTNMERMFTRCSSLTSLNLSSFDTSKVTSMDYMFNYCENLSTTIVIRSNVSGTISYSYMFSGAATASDAKITVNYTSATSTLVDSMIVTGTGNVVKGTQTT